jgi:hypothetical protein
MSFSSQPNELLMKEFDHILKDDDSDLLYFDKTLNLFDNNLTDSVVGLRKPKEKSISSGTTSSLNSTTNSVNSENVTKPVLNGDKGKKNVSAKPKIMK